MNFTDPQRLDLEAHWRIMLKAAQERFSEAAAKHREAVEERRHGLARAPGGAFAVTQAAKAKAAARREYNRVLHVYTELFAYAKEPSE